MEKHDFNGDEAVEEAVSCTAQLTLKSESTQTESELPKSPVPEIPVSALPNTPDSPQVSEMPECSMQVESPESPSLPEIPESLHIQSPYSDLPVLSQAGMVAFQQPMQQLPGALPTQMYVLPQPQLLSPPPQEPQERTEDFEEEEYLNYFVNIENPQPGPSVPHVAGAPVMMPPGHFPAPPVHVSPMYPSFVPSMVFFPTGNVTGTTRDPRTLFVGGIAPETTDRSLREFFKMYGDVVSARVYRGNTERCFGFVTFRRKSQAFNVLENPTLLMGSNNLRLRPAFRTRRPPTYTLYDTACGGRPAAPSAPPAPIAVPGPIPTLTPAPFLMTSYYPRMVLPVVGIVPGLNIPVRIPALAIPTLPVSVSTVMPGSVSTVMPGPSLAGMPGSAPVAMPVTSTAVTPSTSATVEPGPSGNLLVRPVIQYPGPSAVVTRHTMPYDPDYYPVIRPRNP